MYISNQITEYFRPNATYIFAYPFIGHSKSGLMTLQFLDMNNTTFINLFIENLYIGLLSWILLITCYSLSNYISGLHLAIFRFYSNSFFDKKVFSSFFGMRTLFSYSSTHKERKMLSSFISIQQ